jgi:putative hemolysin
MTPRTEIEAISVDATPAELQERITTTRHTRIPVYEGSLDRIIGVLLARDVLSVLISRNPLPPLERLMKPPVIVFASWRADNILDEMRRGPHRLAVVQDEYGGTAGIVTFEDLVEALIGPIVDEPGHDAQIDMVDPQQDHTGAQMIDGLTRLADWEELAGVTLPEEDHEAVDTVGGLVMTRLGRIPEIGDRIEVDGLTLCVEELDGRRVALVRMETTDDRRPTAEGGTTTD